MRRFRASHLYENAPAIQDPADRDPDSEIRQSEQEGPDSLISEVVEDRPVERAVKRAPLPVGAGDLDPQEQKRRERREDEERNRVHAEPDEGSRPRLPSLHVHDPETKREAHGCQARHEEGVRGCPQVLVDREGDVPEEPKREADGPSSHEAGELGSPALPKTKPLSGEDPEKSRRNGRQAREQSLGVPAGVVLPSVGAQDRAVEVGREVAFDIQAPGAVARDRDEGHQRPVHREKHSGRREESPAANEEIDQRREEETDADPLKHARNPHLSAVEQEEGERIERETETENNRRAPQRVEKQS